ncbi:MAG: YggT family protein [Clostridia bacterium]|nr:YggT family protein [Clostridia bacterium]
MIGIVLYRVLLGVSWVLRVFSYTLLIRAFLSWVVRPNSQIYQFFYKLTEPFIAPFRPLAYRITGDRLPIDISFLLCFLVVWLLQRLVARGMMYCMMYL